jgi:uncharacterized membrane protein
VEIKERILNLYKSVLVVFFAGAIFLFGASFNNHHAFWKSLRLGLDDYFIHNVIISLCVYIIIFSPLAYLAVFYLISLIFPSLNKVRPSRPRANRVISVLAGITLGFLSILIVLLVNGHKAAVDPVVLLMSLSFMFTVSVGIFSYRDIGSSSSTEE